MKCKWCNKESIKEYCGIECEENYNNFSKWKQNKNSCIIEKVKFRKKQKLNRYKFAQELIIQKA